MDEYQDFKYDDFASIQEEYKYEGSRRTQQQYYQISLSGGYPVFSAASLKENERYSGPKEKIYPNLTGSIQFPYFQMGAVDISPGIRLMNYGFDSMISSSLEITYLSYSVRDFEINLDTIPHPDNETLQAWRKLYSAFYQNLPTNDRFKVSISDPADPSLGSWEIDWSKTGLNFYNRPAWYLVPQDGSTLSPRISDVFQEYNTGPTTRTGIAWGFMSYLVIPNAGKVLLRLISKGEE